MFLAPSWLTLAFAGLKDDPTVQNDYVGLSFGALHWFTNDGSRHP